MTAAERAATEKWLRDHAEQMERYGHLTLAEHIELTDSLQKKVAEYSELLQAAKSLVDFTESNRPDEHKNCGSTCTYVRLRTAIAHVKGER